MSELLDLVHTLYRGMETNDLDLAMSVFDPDVETAIPNSSLTGSADLRGLLGAFLTAVPDNRLRIIRHLEDGDTILIEATYSGTHTGPLVSPSGTIPPTEQAFSFPYADVLTARAGKVVTRHIYWDNVTFLSQLGVLPAA
jgi:ketosteroid isomerase-like protein